MMNALIAATLCSIVLSERACCRARLCLRPQEGLARPPSAVLTGRLFKRALLCLRVLGLVRPISTIACGRSSELPLSLPTLRIWTRICPNRATSIMAAPYAIVKPSDATRGRERACAMQCARRRSRASGRKHRARRRADAGRERPPDRSFAATSRSGSRGRSRIRRHDARGRRDACAVRRRSRSRSIAIFPCRSPRKAVAPSAAISRPMPAACMCWPMARRAISRSDWKSRSPTDDCCRRSANCARTIRATISPSFSSARKARSASSPRRR